MMHNSLSNSKDDTKPIPCIGIDGEIMMGKFVHQSETQPTLNLDESQSKRTNIVIHHILKYLEDINPDTKELIH